MKYTTVNPPKKTFQGVEGIIVSILVWALKKMPSVFDVDVISTHQVEEMEAYYGQHG